MPRAPGHTLVIPKAPARNLLYITEQDFAEVARATRLIARAAMPVFNADGIMIVQFSEPASGQEVYHLHMHVIPRFDGVSLLPPATVKADMAVLAEQAAKLGIQLAKDVPVKAKADGGLVGGLVLDIVRGGAASAATQ